MSAPDQKYDGPNKGYLRRAHSVFAVLGGLYLLIVILLSVPSLQTQLVITFLVFALHNQAHERNEPFSVLYMNHLRYPLFPKYDAPERYGLARKLYLSPAHSCVFLIFRQAGKTLNFHITTSDNVTLGAWFVLSDTYYREVPFPEPPSYPSLEARIPLAIKTRPTVLFFHGNAATRAAPYRVQYYKAFSSRLHANVLVIDYRGFGDSEGVPSESGLAADAHAAWDWLISNGANPENILIVGHSLGSAVAAKLSTDLADQGVTFKGLVLMSPFSSIRTLLEAYHFFGFIPLIKPLRMIPGLHGAFNNFLPLVWISVYVPVEFLTRPLAHTFDTLSIIPVCNQTSIHVDMITMSV
jgi:abhydrolase domain-containing protein 12